MSAPKIRGIAGGTKRIPIAQAIAFAELGVMAARPKSTLRQIDDRIRRVLGGNATDEDRRRLVEDLMTCERNAGPLSNAS